MFDVLNCGVVAFQHLSQYLKKNTQKKNTQEVLWGDMVGMLGDIMIVGDDSSNITDYSLVSSIFETDWMICLRLQLRASNAIRKLWAS